MRTNTEVTKKKNKKGFTLIEVIAVLVLLGILAAIAVPQYLNMADAARDNAIDAAIAELNSRESLAWGNALLTSADPTAVAADTNLGADYTVTANDITFEGVTVGVARALPTATQPAVWARN